MIESEQVMLDIKKIRENFDKSQIAMNKRGVYDLNKLVVLDQTRRDLIGKIELLKQEKNSLTKSIRDSNQPEQVTLKDRIKEVSSSVKELDNQLQDLLGVLHDLLLNIPNFPSENTVAGSLESDNVLIRTIGDISIFDFEIKSHDELAEQLKILDFKRASKLAGARFSLQFGSGALIERALINFMLDIHTKEHDYLEVQVPLIVNSKTMEGTGQLPKFKDDLFEIVDKDGWLIPTAEVALTNIFANEIVDESKLPLAFCAYTPCFRSEAGSYGKETKGLIRQHQFNKVELVRIVSPIESDAALNDLTLHAEEILKRLDLPYQVVSLCSGELAFSASQSYDIEVWIPSQKRYVEISSCSNCSDFQSRRMNMRVKNMKGGSETYFPHTLNGSALAVGRTVVAILENYQNKDGSITIPESLRSYMGNLEVLE